MTLWEQMKQAYSDGYNRSAPKPAARPPRQVGMLLHELAPRGQVETMLAQRVISARVRLREAEATVDGLRKMQRGDQLTQNISRQTGIDADIVAYAYGHDILDAATKAVLTAERALITALKDLRHEQDQKKEKKRK